MQSSAQDALYDTREITSYGVKVLWLLFTLFIFYGALIPFEFSFSKEQVISRIENFSWVPFFRADGSRHSLTDIVQNILFFIPFGFFGVLSFARNKFFALFLVTFFGFLISLNVEILQLFTESRNTSLTDLVCNTLGTGIGALSALIVFSLFCLMMRTKTFRQVINNQYYYLFMLALFIIAAGTLQPFDFTLDVSTVWSGVKEAFAQSTSFSTQLTDELVVGFRFFLFSVITCLWLRSVNYTLWPIVGVFVSASIGVCFELAQFIVVSRSPSAQDMFVVMLSCSLGGVFISLLPKNVKSFVWIAPLVIFAIISAAVQTLAPFEIRSQHVSISTMPFLSYYHASIFTAIANFLEVLITYIPLGFALQYAISSRRSAFMVITIIVGLVAYCLEYMQGWVVGRYPDVTDVIAAVIGATFAGSLCLRWSRVFFSQTTEVNAETKEIIVT